MARASTIPTNRIEAPNGGGQQRPYKSHPIWCLRKALIVTACIGFFFAVVGYNQYDSPGVGFSFVCFGLSTLLALLDLWNWATKRDELQYGMPPWPSAALMIAEALLAILQLCMFIGGTEAAESGYDGSHTVKVYAALSNLICGGIHIYSFWRELIIRCETKLLAEIEQEPCGRCGYLEHSGVMVNEQEHTQPPNIFPYAGPSAQVPSKKGCHVTPPSSEDAAMEEGLLIGSDFDSSNYSTIEPDPVVAQPEEIVASKGKKKRVLGKQVAVS